MCQRADRVICKIFLEQLKQSFTYSQITCWIFDLLNIELDYIKHISYLVQKHNHCIFLSLLKHCEFSAGSVSISYNKLWCFIGESNVFYSATIPMLHFTAL